MILLSLLISLPSFGGTGAVTTPPSSDVPDTEVESVIRRYDLAAYGKRHRAYEHTQFLMAGSFQSHDRDDGEDFWLLDPDLIQDAINELNAEELEYEGRQIWWTDNDKMIVKGPESLHARIRSTLEMFGAAVSSNSSLRVDVLTIAGRKAPKTIPTGLVGLEQIEGILGQSRGAVVESYEVELLPNKVTRLDATMLFPFVPDYDVEVAEDAYCHDPQRTSMISGMRIQVDAAPAKGGCNMALIVMHGDLAGPMDEHSMSLRGQISTDSGVQYGDGPEKIQSLSMAQRTFALNTGIPDGKALVLHSGLELSRADSEQYVVIRRLGGHEGAFHSTDLGGEADLHLIRNDALANPHLYITGELINAAFHSERLRQRGIFEWSPLTAHFRRSDSHAEREVINDVLHNLSHRHEDEWTMIHGGNLEHGKPTKQLLGETIDAIAPSCDVVTVELAVKRQGEGLSNGLSCTVPLLVGQRSAVVLGIEGPKLVDYDVEIAKRSSVSDPIVVVDLDGIALAMTPTRMTNGSLSLHIVGGVNLLREVTTFDPRNASHGVIDEEVFDRIIVDQTLSIDPERGEKITIGSSGGAGAAEGIRLEIQVR